MDNYDNYGLNINNNKKDNEKNINLNEDDRIAFENELTNELKRLEDNERTLFQETNDLINDALETIDEDASPLINNPLDRNPLYKQMAEDYKRKSILDSDPTGKRKKAAGEDS